MTCAPSSVSCKVDDHCAEYRDLLLSLDKLWKPWTELGKYKCRLEAAQNDLAETRMTAEALEEDAVEKHRQWQVLRDSGRTRGMTKMKSSLITLEVLMAEHREAYDAAYMAERECRALVDEQTATVASLEDKVADLSPKAAEYESLDERLTSLLERIFDGPTPSYPKEDDAEARYNALTKECSKLEVQAREEGEAYRSVKAALKYTNIAVQDLYQAHHLSIDTAYHPERDFLEQFACSSGAAIFQLAQMMIEDAQTLQPGIAHFEPIDVGYSWDRLLAKDRHVVQRVARAWSNLRKLSQQLAVVVPLSKQLRDERQAQAKRAHQEMVDARVELRRLRQDIMDRACARWQASSK